MLERCLAVDLSIDFSQRSHPNEMLTGLRYFERVSKGDNGGIQKVS